MIECLKMHKENFDYCLGELIRESEEKDKEIERLNNIINEVREYIEETHYYSEVINEEYLLKSELKRILDKENKEWLF